MLDFASTHSLHPLVAVGGNSRAARSARARLQWRDRYGRWVDMGRGIKFKVRLPDGTVRNVNGKFVGAADSETGQVYVQNDPSGLKDGFYQVKSPNAQEILGTLSDDALAKRGITRGYDADGAPIADRMDEDIPNLEDVAYSEAPLGWKRQPDRGNAQVWETEDGDYRLYHDYFYNNGVRTERWSVEDVRRDPGRMQGWKDIGFALKQIDSKDNLPLPEENAANEADRRAANEEARNGLARLNDTTVPLKDRVADFDTDGEVARLIDEGATGEQVIAAMRKSEDWKNVENDLFHPADIRNENQKNKDAVYEKLRQEILANKGGEPAPEGENAPEPETPDVPGETGDDANLDVDSFNVAPEGFLIPTGKVTNDGTPEGIAQFIEENREYLTEESGKRLLVDSENGQISSVEIATSADTLDNAKAQAGGIGAPEFYDVAANKTIGNDKNLNNPAQESPNAEDSGADSGEPERDDAGSGAPVQSADSGDGGEPAADSAAERDALGEPVPADRAGLEQRLAFLERATQRVSPDSPKFDATYEARDDIKARLDNFEEPKTEEKKPESAPEAPADEPAEKSEPKAESAPAEEKKPKFAVGDTVYATDAKTGATRAYRVTEVGDDGAYLISPKVTQRGGDNSFNQRFTEDQLNRAGEKKEAAPTAEEPKAEEPEESKYERAEGEKAVPAPYVPGASEDEEEGFPAPPTIEFPDGSKAVGYVPGDETAMELSDRIPKGGRSAHIRNVLRNGSDDGGYALVDANGDTQGYVSWTEYHNDKDETDYEPWMGEGDLTIKGLYANNPQDGSGSGSKLMQAAATYAKDNGLEMGVSGAVPDARPFYAAMGGEVSDRSGRVAWSEEDRDALAAGTPNDRRAERAWLPEEARQPAVIAEPEAAPTPEAEEVPVSQIEQQIQSLERTIQSLQAVVERNNSRIESRGARTDGLIGQQAVSPEEENARIDRLTAQNEQTSRQVEALRAQIAQLQSAPDIAAPAEAPVEAPESLDEGDGLPDDIESLEALAGAMERQIAGARPSRARVLQREVDRIYDKIDRLEGEGEAPASPDLTGDRDDDLNTAERDLLQLEPELQAEVDEVERQLAEDALADPEFAAQFPVEIQWGAGNNEEASAYDEVGNERIRNVAAGKELTPQQENRLNDLNNLTPEQRDELIHEIDEAPNQANTVTKPRPVEARPAALVQASPELLDIENDPNEIVDPNLIMADVRKNHPNHYELPNGDVVIESKEANGRRYDLVVRRTDRERFFAYIMETDAEGNRRASRLQVETHSYAALRTKIGKGKSYLREHGNLTQWMNRRQNREILGKEDLKDNRIEEYINGTDIPRTSNEVYNRMVEGIADLANQSNVPRHFLDALAAVGGQKPEFVDTVLEAVNRRKLIDAAAAKNPADQKESHLSVDGVKIEKGDWIDWTDDKQTRPVKDEFGNTVYQTDENGNFVLRPNGTKIALNEPNPDYGKVFRGRVMQLRYKTNDGKYVYSDATYVVFPELNERAGRKPSHQVARISSQLKVVDGQNAPKSEPFFARKQEKQNQANVQADFNLPDAAAAQVGMPPRPKPSAPQPVEVEIDNNGAVHVDGFQGTPVPFDKVEASMILQNAEPRTAQGGDLENGDLLVGMDDNGNAAVDVVVDVEPLDNGRVRVRSVRNTEDGHELRERELGIEKVQSFRPDEPPVDAPANPIQKPVGEWAVGDMIADEHIPGGKAKIEAVVEGRNADRSDWAFKVRGVEDNETYWVMGSEVAQPVEIPDDEQNPRPWHNDPATSKQVYALKRIAATRKLTPQERASIYEAVANPNMTKKQASDLISAFGARAKGAYDPAAPVNVMEQLVKSGDMPAGQLADVKANLLKDAADGPDPDKYGGQPVKVIKWSDIKFGANGPFENISRLGAHQLQVGDLLPYGRAHDRVYLQVVGRGKYDTYQFRVITQRPGQFVYINRAARANGDVFEMYPYRAQNIKRPTDKVAKDYFVDPNNIPKPKPKRGANFVPVADAPEDPRFLERLRESGDKLVERYNKGYKIIAQPNGGIDHERADIIETAGGHKMFVKAGKPRGGGLWDADTQFKHEVMANRVANALGINEVQMGYLDDNRTLIMDVIDGDVANARPDLKNKILDDIWNYDNAWRIGVLDYLVGNADRHGGNWMINEKNQPIPIDHGRVGFNGRWSDVSPFAEALLRDLRSGNAPLTSAQLIRLKNNIAALYPEFAKFGMVPEYNSVLNQIEKLIGKAKK